MRKAVIVASRRNPFDVIREQLSDAKIKFLTFPDVRRGIEALEEKTNLIIIQGNVNLGFSPPEGRNEWLNGIYILDRIQKKPDHSNNRTPIIYTVLGPEALVQEYIGRYQNPKYRVWNELSAEGIMPLVHEVLKRR